MKLKNIIIAGSIAWGIAKVLKGLNKRMDEIIAELERQIDFLKAEQIPVKYRIETVGNGSISVTVRFYDTDKNQITGKKFTMVGNTVVIDVIIVKIDDVKHIGFPVKIYTDKIAPINGIDITQLYSVDGFPEIFATSENQKPEYIDAMKQLFEMIRTGNYDDIQQFTFGSAVQPAWADVQAGNIFDLIIHTKGGVELRKE